MFERTCIQSCATGFVPEPLTTRYHGFTQSRGGLETENWHEMRRCSSNDGIQVISPKNAIAGKSQAEWTTDWWQWAYSIPTDKNPLSDTTGQFAGVKQPDSIYFLAGALFIPGITPDPTQFVTRTITVPQGVTLFTPVLNVQWDNVQLSSFYGLPALSPPELRNLNNSFMKTAENLFFEVKVGDTWTPLIQGKDWNQYRQSTPTCGGFDYTLPQNNYLGISLDQTDNGKGLVQNSLSDGNWVAFNLSPGIHEIRFGGTFLNSKIEVDLDGNHISNEPGLEATYQSYIRNNFSDFSLGVNYTINVQSSNQGHGSDHRLHQWARSD
jgi:hypothetical protein